jgi:hypothetical protein
VTIAPVRAKQTTTTTGTGTLTLISPTTAAFRSFAAALGTSAVITEYVVAFATGYEIGVGTYDGATPGTLTRATILASSNSGAAVSLPAGTHDVFIPLLPGKWGLIAGTGSDVLGASAMGSRYVWTGTTNQTLTMPPVANVPPDVGLPIINGGTAILTVDGNGAETILGRGAVLLYPGQSIEPFRRGSAWLASGFSEGPPIYKSGVSATVSGTVAITFATAFPNAIDPGSITVTIAGRSGTGTVAPLAIGANSTTGFTVWGAASESLDFTWSARGW